jgi:hypothetical protein
VTSLVRALCPTIRKGAGRQRCVVVSDSQQQEQYQQPTHGSTVGSLGLAQAAYDPMREREREREKKKKQKIKTAVEDYLQVFLGK